MASTVACSERERLISRRENKTINTNDSHLFSAKLTIRMIPFIINQNED
ncbi:hypothetical protein yruck0001_12300 [Yersinia ruckeri ATCC 29473]|nr:hypothetical protein yruck0001_12300 [Yersinia ruckeri ATCC 29473]